MSNQSTRVFIAMGSNLGNPLQQLDVAAMAIGAHQTIVRVAMSPAYESVPHGVKEQPNFINAVMEVQTTLSPIQLLTVLQEIEAAQGRQRKIRWGARTLDLDIIMFGSDELNEDSLIIPHPRAHLREFVVKPLYDLDDALMMPARGAIADLVLGLPLENLKEIRHGITYNH